jgi:hypothetical protein
MENAALRALVMDAAEIADILPNSDHFCAFLKRVILDEETVWPIFFDIIYPTRFYLGDPFATAFKLLTPHCILAIDAVTRMGCVLMHGYEGECARQMKWFYTEEPYVKRSKRFKRAINMHSPLPHCTRVVYEIIIEEEKRIDQVDDLCAKVKEKLFTEITPPPPSIYFE